VPAPRAVGQALASFPWTFRFGDEVHPLGRPVHAVQVPAGSAEAVAAHATTFADALDAPTALFAYPGSWGVQSGIRPEPFRGEIVDYLRYAPRYLAATSSYAEKFAAACGLVAAVTTVVFPTVSMHERKLAEFALSENPDMVHPTALDSGRAFAEELCRRAVTGGLPKHIILFTFSYGGALALQHLTLILRRCAEQPTAARCLAEIRARLVVFMVAPNFAYPTTLPVRLVVLRSPLDAVVMGNPVWELRTSVHNDHAMAGLPVSVRADLMTGRFDGLRGSAYPVRLGPSCTQWNCPLPGAVGLAADGGPLEHFDDLRDGHDIRQYAPVYTDPRLTAFLRLC
jgi:hypothetical protein